MNEKFYEETEPIKNLYPLNIVGGRESFYLQKDVEEWWDKWWPHIQEWRRCYTDVVPTLQIKLTEVLVENRKLRLVTKPRKEGME